MDKYIYDENNGLWSHIHVYFLYSFLNISSV